MRNLLQRARNKEIRNPWNLNDSCIHDDGLNVLCGFLPCYYACIIARVRFEQSISCKWRDCGASSCWRDLSIQFNTRFRFYEILSNAKQFQNRPFIDDDLRLSHIISYRCLTLFVLISLCTTCCGRERVFFSIESRHRKKCVMSTKSSSSLWPSLSPMECNYMNATWSHRRTHIPFICVCFIISRERERKKKVEVHSQSIRMPRFVVFFCLTIPLNWITLW